MHIQRILPRVQDGRMRIICGLYSRILLANPLQSSSSTFSWGSFLGFFAFKEGVWDTQIAALLSSPTVSLRIPNRLLVYVLCSQHVSERQEACCSTSLME